MPDGNEPIIPDDGNIIDPDDSNQTDPVPEPDDTEPEVIVRRTTSCYVRIHKIN